MSFYRASSIEQPIRGVQVTRRPILALSHPGGLHAGVTLPPTWFNSDEPVVTVPSALPEPGDTAAILEAVSQMCIDIRDAAMAAIAAGDHPVLIGGDHSLAMGSLAAATASAPRVGVIWIDAHADFNTPDSSPSGNPHGMPLAVACGLGEPRYRDMFSRFVNPADVVLIGAREIDPGEAQLLRTHGVTVIGIPELRRIGIPALVARVSEQLGGVPVHLSFDFDAISEEFFSATGTPSPNGMTPAEAETLLEGLVASGLSFTSTDWVEFDPRHETATAAAETARRMYKAFYGE